MAKQTNKSEQEKAAVSAPIQQEQTVTIPASVDQETGEVIPETTQTIVPANEDNANLLASIAASENLANMKPVLQLSAEYIQLQVPGDYFDAIFIGFQDITVKDIPTGELKTITAARFAKDRKIVINAGASLVKQLQNTMVPPQTPLRVTFSKKDNNTKVYELTLLG